MSLVVSQEQVAREWALLGEQWRTTSSLWNDAVRVQFETRYWQLLERAMPQYLWSLQELAQVATQARQNVR